MTENASHRVQIRLLSMSTEDLRNLAGADDRFVYTDAERVRYNRTKDLVNGELARRTAAQ